MPFFFSKKPASVAQDMGLSGDHPPPKADSFEVELLGHLDTLYGVSCRMTKSTAEAEDLVQDTVVKAMRAKDQFTPGTNLKAWLLRILTNTFINRYRRGGLERDLFEGPEADSLTDGWVGATTMRAMRDPETQARISQYEMAFRMQTSVPELTDMRDEPASTWDLYGPEAREPGTFAYNCLLARRMAERGVRFTQIYQRGWDVHLGAVTALPILCRATDRACYALVTDLKQRGLLDDTLVVWGGEFGRTIYSQGGLSREAYGRDHHIRCYPPDDNAEYAIMEAGGAIFFAYGVAHATGSNNTKADRAGAAFHFLNANHIPGGVFKVEENQKGHPTLTGPNADGGLSAYGEDLSRAWECTVDEARLQPAS